MALVSGALFFSFHSPLSMPVIKTPGAFFWRGVEGKILRGCPLLYCWEAEERHGVAAWQEVGWQHLRTMIPKPSLRFYLLSFGPRSNTVLSGDFFFLHFSRIFGSSPSYFRQIQTLTHTVWSPCYSSRTEKIKVGEVRDNLR